MFLYYVKRGDFYLNKITTDIDARCREEARAFVSVKLARHFASIFAGSVVIVETVA